ncbi:hypothetical protein ACFQZW_00025 [Lutibacter aestuarii]|uniref:DUF4377 domain-containing protein n=1 Tax=Lutibacter aestuarii TaxID=861111 RepID=A0ABW2Z0S2_9FLAO|nr:hypothetical protein [uncultured Lutibacter sp.]
MKTLLTIVAFISLITVKNTQDNLTVKAAFDGFEEGYYYFSDTDDNTYSFEEINEETSKKYNLTEEKYIGKNFKITYKIVTKTDEYDEEYEAYVIVNLEMEE